MAISREYGALHVQERKNIGQIGEFLGRIYDAPAVEYIRQRAKKESLSETQLCNRILREAVRKLIDESK